MSILPILLAGALVYKLTTFHRKPTNTNDTTNTNKIKIFVYGSLMWDTIPFQHTATKMTLKHYKRKLCLSSYTTRGTYTNPGLFWGLTPHPNANCLGKLLTFTDNNVLDWMDTREGDMYRRTKLNHVFVYLPNTQHTQYHPNLSPEQINHAYQYAHGQHGSTKEYVDKTLHELKILENS